MFEVKFSNKFKMFVDSKSEKLNKFSVSFFKDFLELKILEIFKFNVSLSLDSSEIPFHSDF